jgi:predicted ester cyclase
MPEENKSLIRRLYDEGINRHDAVAAAAFYSVDAKNHGHTVGRGGMQKVFEALFSTFPDFTYRIEEATAEGDRVVCKVTFSGMLAGVAPTHRHVQVLQFHSFRVRGGQISEHSAVRDDLGMLKQLGVIN